MEQLSPKELIVGNVYLFCDDEEITYKGPCTACIGCGFHYFYSSSESNIELHYPLCAWFRGGKCGSLTEIISDKKMEDFL